MHAYTGTAFVIAMTPTLRSDNESMMQHKLAMRASQTATAFTYLEPEAMRMLASLSSSRVFQAGELVLAQGSCDQCCYVVLSGRYTRPI